MVSSLINVTALHRSASAALSRGWLVYIFEVDSQTSVTIRLPGRKVWRALHSAFDSWPLLHLAYFLPCRYRYSLLSNEISYRSHLHFGRTGNGRLARLHTRRSAVS